MPVVFPGCGGRKPGGARTPGPKSPPSGPNAPPRFVGGGDRGRRTQGPEPGGHMYIGLGTLILIIILILLLT